MRSRSTQVVGAIACFLVGLVLLVLAVDTARWHEVLGSADVRFRGTPEAELWKPDALAPGGVVESALGTRDDVAYRRALRAFRLSHPERPVNSDPNLVVFRNEAIAELTDLVLHSQDRGRRSAAANLLGVISYSGAVYDYAQRTRMITSAARWFERSIAFDPENADAKYNLELALGLARGAGLNEGGGGTNPSPGGRGSKGAGAGDPGSGY